jgi:hypothetical protein
MNKLAFIELDKISFTRYLLVAILFLVPSAFTYGYSIIKGNILFIIISAIILISKKKFNIFAIIIVVISFFLGFLSSAYNNNLGLIKLEFYFIASVLIVSSLDKDDLKALTKISSIVILFILFFSFIGYLYALIGGGPILIFLNEDGRENYLYLSTLTNSVHNNLIRPSGIFDEPGALSFVTCFIVAIRKSLGFNSRLSILLLLLQLITTSLAGLIFLIFFLADFIYKVRFKNMAIGIFIFLVMYFLVGDIVFQRLSDPTTGSDRGQAMIHSFDYLNLNTFLWGLHFNCIDFGDLECKNFGENPLTLLVGYGIFFSLPYYCSLFYLLYQSIRLHQFFIFGLFLLLLQRPYTLYFAYAFLIFLTMYSIRFFNPALKNHQYSHRT